MRNWRNLINTFNNLVFLKAEGEYIYVEGTMFAAEGFERILHKVRKELLHVEGNIYKFNRSFVGFNIEEVKSFFKNN